jgi:hypothetical protein
MANWGRSTTRSCALSRIFGPKIVQKLHEQEDREAYHLMSWLQ